jgi:hypothetical protein
MRGASRNEVVREENEGRGSVGAAKVYCWWWLEVLRTWEGVNLESLHWLQWAWTGYTCPGFKCCLRPHNSLSLCVPSLNLQSG